VSCGGEMGDCGRLMVMGGVDGTCVESGGREWKGAGAGEQRVRRERWKAYYIYRTAYVLRRNQ
jgi:hypothetical protein